MPRNASNIPGLHSEVLGWWLPTWIFWGLWWLGWGVGPLAASSLSVFFSVMEQVYERG